MSIRSLDGALTSESCYDTFLPDSFFYPPHQAKDIAKWSEDVTGSISPEDFFCVSPESDPAGPEDIGLKNDTSSVSSMDSAYHSQTGAGSWTTRAQTGQQTVTDNATRGRMGSIQVGSDIFSPTLSAEAYPPYEFDKELNHNQLPQAVGDETYTAYTTAQDGASYMASNAPRFHPWDGADAQGLSGAYPFTYINDQALYPSPDQSETFFMEPQPVHPMAYSRLKAPSRPGSTRPVPSFGSLQNLSQSQVVNDALPNGYFVAPLEAHVADPRPKSTSESRFEHEDSTTASLTAQSLPDEDDQLSASDAAEARVMEEEQGQLARSHPLYSEPAGPDGKYHCPNEGKPGCNHKPTSLKCNYDKYVDSHLKPFRCNKSVCVGVQFSSTACLLRHEREAHGMHGHGSRPNLCHFKDCERAVEGNGFPRRYNLFDHMKRVHDYVPTDVSAATTGSTASGRKAPGRKRKASSSAPTERPKKVIKLTAQQLKQQRKVELQEQFESTKQTILDIVAKLTGPTDLNDQLQLTKEVGSLHEISSNYQKEMGG